MDFSINNLRSLSSPYTISLKPITILVGKNSSGKSTFARTFPLMRQSIESKLRGNILWNGSLTDFGSYVDSINRDAASKNEPITIHFKDVLDFAFSDYRYELYRKRMINHEENLIYEISISYRYNETDNSTYMDKIHLFFFDHELYFSFDNKGKLDKAFINKQDFTRFFKDVFIDNNSLLPILYTETKNGFFPAYITHRGDSGLVENAIKEIDGRFSSTTANSIASSIQLDSKINMLTSMKRSRFGRKSWTNAVSSWTLDNFYFNNVINSRIANGALILISEVFSDLNNKISTTKYVGPARAAARRFYRIQDVAVDEIDPFGDNLALYLSSLSSTEMESFKDWCTERLGVYFSVTSSTGHVSLKIADGDHSQSFDLADVGFGYSQMLPILAQLWTMEKRIPTVPRAVLNNSRQILIVEQPELHLHPKMQSVLMDIIIKTANSMIDSRLHPSIILETHSEVMINRLGELVYENKFSGNNAVVYIFDKNEQNITVIKEAVFHKDGRLENWPRGFFTSGNI